MTVLVAFPSDPSEYIIGKVSIFSFLFLIASVVGIVLLFWIKSKDLSKVYILFLEFFINHYKSNLEIFQLYNIASRYISFSVINLISGSKSWYPNSLNEVTSLQSVLIIYNASLYSTALLISKPTKLIIKIRISLFSNFTVINLGI